tara:strand:- start:107 stop:727 length:621 start_codon:yes stop_codon:yes gene_type:complete
MTTRFPKNPANGTQVSLGGRSWRFNSTYGVWDKVLSSISGVSYEFLANGLTQNGPTLSIDTTVNIALQGFSSSQGASFHGPVYALDGISLGAGGISFNDATGINTALRTDSYTGHIETAADKTYTIDPAAATARTITAFFIKSASGTVTATLKNGSDTIKAASVSSSSGAQTSLANTSVAADGVITIVTSSNSSALDVIFGIDYTS